MSVEFVIVEELQKFSVFFEHISLHKADRLQCKVSHCIGNVVPVIICYIDNSLF